MLFACTKLEYEDEIEKFRFTSFVALRTRKFCG